MNPYARFGLVSNSVSAAVVVGALIFIGGDFVSAIFTSDMSSNQKWASVAGALTVMVVFWLAMTEAIFPTLFRFNWVRKMILGKYYVEGTWLQAEKGAAVPRMAVIDIQPNGKSFTFSGYALDHELEIESNILIEFSKFEWPFMTYKYRNTLSDGSDGQREGVGEVQFEMNREASRRYNGFFQHIKNVDRVKIEGAKLTRNRDVRALRSLEGREEIFDKYWSLFFDRSARRASKLQAAGLAPRQAQAMRGPSAHRVEENAMQFEPMRASSADETFDPRSGRHQAEMSPSDLEETIIPRRRSSDWGDERPNLEEETAEEPFELSEAVNAEPRRAAPHKSASAGASAKDEQKSSASKYEDRHLL